MLDDVACVEEHLGGGRHAHDATSVASTTSRARRFAATSRWQASRWPGPTRGSSAGRSEQRSKRCGQRGANAHPGGRASSDGGWPRIAASRATRGRSRRGIEPCSPQLYGCCGSSKIARVRADLDGSSGVHDDDAVRRLGHHAHVVGDQDDRRVVIALQPPHQREDLRLDRDIERRGGLVGDQELGVARERHRDHHSLAHAARELVRIVVGAALRSRDADLAEQLDGPPRGGRPRHALVRADLLRDLPADPVDGRQRRHRVLEDHPDLVPAHGLHLPVREGHQVAALPHHAALDDRVRVTDQAHDGHHRHALARAGLADDSEHLAGRDREVDPVDGAHQPRLRAERDAQALHREQRRACLRHAAHAGRGRRTARRPRRWPAPRRRRRTSRWP